MRTKLLGERWRLCIRTGNYYPESLMVKTKKGWVLAKLVDENEDE